MNEQDQEKIEAAAAEHGHLCQRLRKVDSHEVANYAKHDMKLGIRWRDSHPSPAVKGLVESLEKSPCTSRFATVWVHDDINCHKCKALAAYEESLK